MRRFGDRQRFLELLDRIRELAPEAGVRSNFIVGFPGESAHDLEELELFLSSARLDAIGVFGYSDEDGTEAESLPGHLDEAEVARRVEEVADLAEELMSQRGADRIGQTVDVLIEEKVGDGEYEGRSAHQAPEVDGSTTVRAGRELVPGQIVRATVTGSDGVDLTAAADTAPTAPAAPAQDPVRLSTARSLADRR
jgi:tRNA A37 methylthiotransferase MiaB